MSKITVIIPIYNVKAYLKRCVDSVVRQSHKELEIILVDDGSTDGSGELADELAQLDRRIKVIHQQNQGLSAARNTGIEIAGGDYVGFVDSDDFIHQNMYEVLLNLCQEYDTDISVCGFEVVNGDEFQESVEGHQGVENWKEVMLNNFQLYVPAWNKLYRRDLFRDVRFPNGKIYEDLATTYKLFFKAKKISITARNLYGFYQRNGSITHRPLSSRNYDKIEITKEIVEFFRYKDRDVYFDSLKRHFYWCYSYYALFIDLGIEPPRGLHCFRHIVKTAYGDLRESGELTYMDRLSYLTPIFYFNFRGQNKPLPYFLALYISNKVKAKYSNIFRKFIGFSRGNSKFLCLM